MRLMISVHDVMPDTRADVCRVLDWLEEQRLGPVILLVVPGAGWTPGGLRWLRALEAAGHELAGHGWRHAVDRYGGLAHRLHAALISRRVAEHLALDGDAVAGLVARCHGWFVRVGLTPPRLYVPPAWAMGALEPARFPDLPFAVYEDLGGFRLADGTRVPVPVAGFECDRLWTVPFLKVFNAAAARRGASRGLLRVAIHPRDLRLPMARDLAALLGRYAGTGSVPPGPRALTEILAGAPACRCRGAAGQVAGADGSAVFPLSATPGGSSGSMVKPRKP